jgi:hypothetical protein
MLPPVTLSASRKEIVANSTTRTTPVAGNHLEIAGNIKNIQPFNNAS